MSNEILQTLRYLHNAIASINNPDVCEAWLRDADETLSALEVPVKRKLTPEKRKPLSEEEIGLYVKEHRGPSFEAAFILGVRWAEKMHKIGGGDDV